MTNKIILVDDDPIIQYVHLRILKKYSSQPVMQFENGSDALEYFEGNGKVDIALFGLVGYQYAYNGRMGIFGCCVPARIEWQHDRYCPNLFRGYSGYGKGEKV